MYSLFRNMHLLDWLQDKLCVYSLRVHGGKKCFSQKKKTAVPTLNTQHIIVLILLGHCFIGHYNLGDETLKNNFNDVLFIRN